MIDLTSTLINTYQSYPRKVGRYNASDLYGILRGYITPEDYLKGHKDYITSCFAKWQGSWKHKQVQELLEKIGYTCEEKVEYKYEDFVLVGKIDAMIVNDHLLEIKTSEQVMSKAKPAALHQAGLYVNMFPVVVGYVVQPTVTDHKLLLKKIGRVQANREWFEEQLENLKLFHNKLKEYVLEKSK